VSALATAVRRPEWVALLLVDDEVAVILELEDCCIFAEGIGAPDGLFVFCVEVEFVQH